MTPRTWCWITAGAVLLSGCSRSGPTVKGEVLLDGTPLESGSIRFVPVDTKLGPDAGAAIKDGQYKIDKGLRVGEYRVVIRSPRRIPGKTRGDPISNAQVRAEEEAIPRQYNANSELVRKVASGANTFDFPLEGK
jgi:hypothetical protein